MNKCIKRRGGEQDHTYFIIIFLNFAAADPLINQNLQNLNPVIVLLLFLVYICSTNKVIIMIKD
jgi:hypothetical protein